MTERSMLILIVDDNPDDRAEVRRLLLSGSEQRYRFIEVDTGDAAIAACLGQPEDLPDCIILDYHLPDMKADEVLAALRGDRPLPVRPVLVLTGGAEARLGRKLLQAGAQDYFSKDWMNAEALARALEIAIERHRLAAEVQQRKAALRESEERLRLALQASDTGLWIWELATDAVSWSPECYRIFEMDERDFKGTGAAFFNIVHPEDRERIEKTVRGAIAARQLYEAEFRLVRPNGTIVWVANRGRASYDKDGKPLRVLGTVTDISRRKSAEEALRDEARRKDEFLAILAHELRNPLAPLRMGLTVLEKALPGADTERVRRMMERQVGHLVRLIDDLLDVSRINSGKMELVRERLDLRTVVEAAIETSRPIIYTFEHTLSVRIPPGSIWVHGDQTRLAQVVSNLLNNAAKYTPPGGRIILSLEEHAGEAILRVTDNGSGIPREMLSRVFDMFVQVDRTLSRSQGGLGIGLSLVRGLVERHGGRVEAESDGLGKGSTFMVRLPLLHCDSEETMAPRGADTHKGPPPRRILVVDDNIDAADSLAEALRLSGHDVRVSYRGCEVLATVREFLPDVVLLDIGLPDLDGYTVARQLRTEPRPGSVTLVALTGWGAEKDRRLSREAGFDYHLTKPVSLAAVNEVLPRSLPEPGAA